MSTLHAKHLLPFLLLAQSLPAQDSLAGQPRVFASRNMLFGLSPISEHPEFRNTGQPVSFLFYDSHAIDLHLPEYQSKHVMFRKPLLAHDFNWSISPQLKMKSAFINRIITNTEKKFNLYIPATSP